MIGIVDAALGNTVSLPLSSSNVSLSTTQRQNLGFALTGTLSGNVSVSLPLSPNSTSAAVGGEFIFENNTTGAFNVTVNTVVTGSLGVVVPQGARALLYSDTVNVKYGDDTQNQLAAFNGNPNGNVAGYSASVSRRASQVVDRSTNEGYLCLSGSGSAAGTVWVKNMPFTIPAEGYLTANSDPTNPILTGDSLGASTLYYTAFRGNQVWVWNGTSFTPLTIPGGQLPLALSNSSQAANGIYDALAFQTPNGTTLAIAFSPAWQTPTAGSGARGTGAGTPQLSRVNGILVNAVPQTANNGATSYQIGTGLGTYVGSVWIDGSAGQVTCHRTYGQSRKFGVCNAFNREPIVLTAGDPTSSWVEPNSGWQLMHGSVGNSASAFLGLPEEPVNVGLSAALGARSGAGAYAGIGANNTASPSGFTGNVTDFGSGSQFLAGYASLPVTVPFIGVSTFYCLYDNVDGGLGTQTNMQMTVAYNG